MKRFYRQVDVTEAEGGWQVMLDGRGVKTQGGRPQLVPTRAMAAAMAREWSDQGEEIDPSRFTMRDQSDYAIDVIAGDAADAIEKLLAYGDTDTLCYRADPDEPLYHRQQREWEPLVKAFEAREGVQMNRVSGVMHRPQPDETMARLRARLEQQCPFTLAGLQVLTTLAASLTIGLAALEADADIEALWRLANLEEDWQAELWGRDEQAEARQARRRAAFVSAYQWLQLLRD